MAGTAAGIVTAGTIVVTGAAGNIQSFKQARPSRACFRYSHYWRMMSQLRNRNAWLTLSDDSDPDREIIMKRLIGAALVAGALAFAGPSAINQAAAAPSQTKANSSATNAATDFSARRTYRHRYHHYGYRPYDRPTYYARPIYYRPYPYSVPAPFVFGIGFGPSW
jgi:hypothetical protein